MSFMEQEQNRLRLLLTRRMRSASAAEIDEWLTVEPAAWVERFGPSLHDAGLDAQDAKDLHRRLGPSVANSLARLIDQGRMADIDIRYVHLWAASGLLKPSVGQGSRPGRPGPVSFTQWINQAREYIKACDGDQHLAAAAAAAGLSVQETAHSREVGELNVEALEMLTALRESLPDGM